MIIESWKPFGITSNDFVSKIRDENHLKKICYVGRLDPMAQGKMLILTDNDTKNMYDYMHLTKVYKFSLVLGISTHTNDPFGDILNVKTIEEKIDESDILDFASKYIKQQIPIISSQIIKYKNFKNPSWWYYVNKIDIEDYLPLKDVKIKQIEIHSYKIHKSNDLIEKIKNLADLIINPKTIEDLNIPGVVESYSKIEKDLDWHEIEMSMHVNSGFYIRKFCSDIGKYFNMPAIAMYITRTEIKNF